MPAFRYQLLDVVQWLPGGLRPMRLALGVACAGWCLLLALVWEAIAPIDFVVPTLGLFPSMVGHSGPWIGIPQPLGWIAFFLLALLWWWGFCFFKLWLFRSAVVRICSDQPQAVTPSFVYAKHFSGSLFMTPLAAALLGLVASIPFAVVGAVVATLASVFGADAPWWRWFAAIALAPLALMLAFWFLTLPLTFAAIALHGGDAWESQNRGLVWGLRGILTYAPLSLVEHGLVAAFLIWGMPYFWAESWILGVASLGLMFALWTTMDVAIGLLARHRVEGTPVSVYFKPTHRFEVVISEQERAMARKTEVSPTGA